MRDLKAGTIVRALRDLDPHGARVREGDLGVVHAEAGYYGPGYGPLVQWFRVVEDERQFPMHSVGLGGICNVYEGDVQVVAEPDG